MIESLNKLKGMQVGCPTTYTREDTTSLSGMPPTDFFSSIIGESQPERDIRDIPLSELHEFNGHIFTIDDGPDMDALVESLKTVGQLEPALVRLRPAGGYELIAGHRRRRAHELAGLPTMKCLVVKMDDDTAERSMMESNKHRPFIPPSTKAKIYEREMELYERQQGRRTDLEQTSASDLPKLRWRDEIGKNWGVSGETVRQYILLNHLIPPLLSAVDNAACAVSGSSNAEELQMSLRAGVVISEMDEASQLRLAAYIDANEVKKISAAQAEALAVQAAAGLTEYGIAQILEPAETKVGARSVRFPIPVPLLQEKASKYKNDMVLQNLIAQTINRYVTEKEAAENT